MEPTIKQLWVLNCVLCGVALLATGLRLWIRHRRRKLWWDDFWIILAALCTIVLMVANFVHTADLDTIPQRNKVVIYYLCIQFYYAVTWTSRLSILFTVIRISVENLRRFLIISAWLFGLSWVVLFAQVFWVCEPEPGWKELPIPQCILGKNVAVAQVITFVVTDAILVFAPVKLTLGAQLSYATKIRLVAIFTATLVTTAVSLYYIYAVLRIGHVTEEYAATIHDGVSLLVANLSVITTFVLRVGNNPSSSKDSPGVQFSSTVRRTPARSFGFFSALSTHGQITTPTLVPAHIHLHIEQIDDRSFVEDPKVDNTPNKEPPDTPESFNGADIFQMREMFSKTPEL